MPVTFQVEGLAELRERFKQWPNKYQRAMGKTITASLLTLWENVPSYPKADPNSTYRRTGTLGRSLGSGEGGGKSGGRPDIYEVKMGTNMSEGSFGTRLGYAPYVIGDERTQQARIHQRRWWTIPQTLVSISVRKIERLFQIMAQELAKWLDASH